jgi:hypothetical protein
VGNQRGLRRSKGKTFCIVLDFVGTHRKEFRFDRRYRALIGGTRRDIERAVQQGFPFLPAGCYMQLDEKASEIVLSSLRDAIPTRWPQRVEELRVVHAAYADVTLSKYLEESGLDLPDVYDGSRSWSDLCEAAGVPIEAAGSGAHQGPLPAGRGRPRLVASTSPRRARTAAWILQLRRLFGGKPSVSAYSQRSRIDMARVRYAVAWARNRSAPASSSMSSAVSAKESRRSAVLANT